MNTDYRPEPPEPWEILGFQRFTKVDWYGLAGAEPFLDGSEPLVLYGEPAVKPPWFDEVGWTFVIDQTGLHAEEFTYVAAKEPDEIGTSADRGVWIADAYDAGEFLKQMAASGKPLTFESVAEAKGAEAY